MGTTAKEEQERSGEEREGLEPGRRSGAGLQWVGSGRQMDREWARDDAVLAWLVRFRFVTVGALSVRWEVSEQQIRARVRRLERERLVRRDRPQTNAPAAIFPTGRALTRLGLPVRQAVHFDGRFGHEWPGPR